MAQHVVIRKDQFVAGTRDKPEVGVFTQTHAARHPIPWGRIVAGETVWIKWSGGPLVGRATVEDVLQIEDCTPDRLREATRGFQLHELEAYWSSLPAAFSGMAIYLRDESWLDEVFVPRGRSHGSSWVVLDRDELLREWLSPRRDRPVGPRTVSPGLRFRVLRRDNFTCVYCGRRPPEVALHVDHVVPWSKGGETTMENLAAACAECNIGKGSMSLSSA